MPNPATKVVLAVAEVAAVPMDPVAPVADFPVVRAAIIHILAVAEGHTIPELSRTTPQEQTKGMAL